MSDHNENKKRKKGAVTKAASSIAERCRGGLPTNRWGKVVVVGRVVFFVVMVVTLIIALALPPVECSVNSECNPDPEETSFTCDAHVCSCAADDFDPPLTYKPVRCDATGETYLISAAGVSFLVFASLALCFTCMPTTCDGGAESDFTAQDQNDRLPTAIRAAIVEWRDIQTQRDADELATLVKRHYKHND